MRTKEITTKEYKLLKEYVAMLETTCASQANVILRQEKEIAFLIRKNMELEIVIHSSDKKQNGLVTRNN